MTTTTAAPSPPPHRPDQQQLAPPPPQTSIVTPKTIDTAVNALLKWRTEKSKTEKPQLLEQDEFIYLVITLKKIPQTNRTKPHLIPLPHPLINTHQEDSPELCLIIDDRAKSGLTKEDVKKKIESDNVPITKILKLSKLKTDYKAYESKRKLCDSFDMFFADRRVIPLLPRLIGKKFFGSKKLPVGVDLKHRNWKEQVERGCGSAMFFMRTGTCSVVRVGKLCMERGEIVENVVEALKGVVEVLPGKWKYVRSLHLKLSGSVALPVYQSVPDLKLRIDAFGGGGKSVKGEEEEKSDVVKEEKKKNKKKGRIHEVRYMDSNVSEVLGDDEIGDVEVSNDIGVKKRKKVTEVAEAEKPKKKVAKGKLIEKSKDELKPKMKKTTVTKQEPGGGLTPKRKKSIVRK